MSSPTHYFTFIFTLTTYNLPLYASYMHLSPSPFYPSLHSTPFHILMLSSVFVAYLFHPYLPHVPLNLPLYLHLNPTLLSHSLPFSYFAHTSLLWYNDAEKSGSVSKEHHYALIMYSAAPTIDRHGRLTAQLRTLLSIVY